jgi:hypothetical protein
MTITMRGAIMLVQRAVAVMLAVAVPLCATAAPSCRASSGEVVRPLVELYTSEGCDSCPPADRWLSASFADAGQAAIPLAFHVDYWDRLGWKDRFADARYTERQHAAAAANRKTFVYTPQVLVQGRDAPWQDARTLQAVVAAAAAPPRAAISVDAARIDDAVSIVASARIDDARLREGAAVGIAFVDSGLSSDVKAGENRGARLSHDHVVRAFATGAVREADGRITARATFTRPREAGTQPTIVAFVQRPATGEVLQAVALPLTDCPAR